MLRFSSKNSASGSGLDTLTRLALEGALEDFDSSFLVGSRLAFLFMVRDRIRRENLGMEDVAYGEEGRNFFEENMGLCGL